MSDTSIRPDPYIEIKIDKTSYRILGDGLIRFDHYITLMNYGNSAYIKLEDVSHEDIEALLEENNTIQFRHGYVGSRSTTWKTYYVDNYISHFKPNISVLELFLREASTGITSNEKNRSFRDMTISEMFSKIASEYGKKAVIEPTRGKFTLRQHNITDDRFIIEWLLPRAIPEDKDKFGDYNYYGVDGKELHFHPIDNKLKDFKTYNGYYDVEHPMRDFKYFAGRASQKYTASRLNVRGYDPIEKKQLLHTIDNTSLDGKQIKFAPKVVELEENSDGTGSYFRTPFKNTWEVEYLANQVWRFQNARAYTAEMKSAADPDLEPGKIINLLLNGEKDGTLLKKSGKYQVDSILYKYNAKKYEMICLLSRNSSGFGSGKTDGVKLDGKSKKSRYISNTVTYDEGDKTVKKTIKSV